MDSKLATCAIVMVPYGECVLVSIIFQEDVYVHGSVGLEVDFTNVCQQLVSSVVFYFYLGRSTRVDVYWPDLS